MKNIDFCADVGPLTDDQFDHYVRCRKVGTSHSLSLMFALGQPPMSNTDREFMEGRCNGNQFERHPFLGDFYKAEAQRCGVNTTGKTYLSGLADYPGDPRAWITGRGDVQRLVEERGWGCEGAVKVKATNFAECGGKYQVADAIVEEQVGRVMASAPEPRDLNVEDVREQVVNKLSPNWD